VFEDYEILKRGYFKVRRKKSSEVEIEKASLHTIKKFELIEEYVKAWAVKLLEYDGCDGVVFIDCMSNSGIYTDGNDDTIYGTPIRASKTLSDIMQRYPNKKALLYFNDWDSKKIEILNKHLEPNTNNFIVNTTSQDGNDLLKQLSIPKNYNFLVIYDPYKASINWDALTGYLRGWGEVIINHMVSDTIRGVSQAKKEEVIARYECTYQSEIDSLLELDGGRKAYEDKIKEIIESRKRCGKSGYYISSFPFFNMANSLVYNLIHYSTNIEGFKLYKMTAWKTFGGKSSSKTVYEGPVQLQLDLTESEEVKSPVDEDCLQIKDIAAYLNDEFKGREGVSFEEVYASLELHPIFPSEGFRNEIKKQLMYNYKVQIVKSTMTFIDNSPKYS
jgi:three-Cys-motif partner protein